MSYLNELGSYQAKVLRTAKAIVEIDRIVAATSDPTQRERLARRLSGLRAMLHAYEGMVSFMNCCIEIDRQRASPASDHGEAKQA